MRLKSRSKDNGNAGRLCRQYFRGKIVIELAKRSDVVRSGLPFSENYLAFRWFDDGHEVFLSAAAQGDSMPIHIAAIGRENKRKLREAVNEFCVFLFCEYPGIRAVVGVIGPKSVINMALKCGFSIVATFQSDTHGEITFVERSR